MTNPWHHTPYDQDGIAVVSLDHGAAAAAFAGLQGLFTRATEDAPWRLVGYDDGPEEIAGYEVRKQPTTEADGGLVWRRKAPAWRLVRFDRCSGIAYKRVKDVRLVMLRGQNILWHASRFTDGAYRATVPFQQTSFAGRTAAGDPAVIEVRAHSEGFECRVLEYD